MQILSLCARALLASLSVSLLATPAIAASSTHTLSLPAPSAFTTQSDVMPPPSRAPRTSVESARLNSNTPEAPAAMMGTAQALDGATIRLHDNARDVMARLLGVVAPPLTTPEGVAARSGLDALLKNQTLDCTRRDRDRDSSLVMSCSFNGGRDLSEAILFTGTTLFSRSAAVDNDLAVRYRAAEETAQAKKLGLWSQAGTQAAAIATPVAVKSTATVVAQPTATVSQDKGAAVTAAGSNTASDNGFAFTTWLEAIGLLGVLFGMLIWLDNRHTRRARLTHELDIRSDRQVLAAALTGELAAARDICEARAALITNGGAPTWPRLRTYIYQAHADQIGLLGAVLARQVASIYGQMADYGASARGSSYGAASGPESDLTTPASVSRALVRLCNYIEITLEGLAEVEHTGEPYYPSNDQDALAEEKHASQLAQQAKPRPAATALPQQKSVQPITNTVPLKRLPSQIKPAVSAPTIDIASDTGPDDDGGEPAVTPTVFPTTEAAEAAGAAKTAEAAKASEPAAVAPTSPEAARSDPTSPAVARSAAAQSRAARRAAMQTKARAGDLFRAEQALREANAELGEEDEPASDAKLA